MNLNFFQSEASRFGSMNWPIGPYGTSMGALLLMTLPIHWFLTRDEPESRVGLRDLPREIREKGYGWHIALYLLMFLYKALIDHHNEPMKARVGGFTHWFWSIEGDWTLRVQEAFENDLLTDILSGHYLFMYLFIIWFSPMYYMLSRDERMADKAALNYFLIYILSVPLYLFFNVEVTSSYIPGMDALLYHDDFTLRFFIDNDPMDNSIPSLHIGLSASLLMINRLHVRELGISISDWRHREFDLFIMANLGVYLFSIQYLGIHWVFDVIPGLMMAVVTAGFVHAVQPVVRARRENGLASLLPDRRQTIAAIGVALLCSSWLMIGVVDGAGVDEDQPNFRFGEGDVVIDAIEVHSLNHPVTMTVKNVGEHSVEVMLVDLRSVEAHTSRGEIDWDSISNFDEKLQIPTGESIEFSVLPNNLFDTHLILARLATESSGGGTLGEVRITPHYVDDELIYTALLASLPAFIIVGIVIEGLLLRKQTTANTGNTKSE